jgi:hypothetical protein
MYTFKTYFSKYWIYVYIYIIFIFQNYKINLKYSNYIFKLYIYLLKFVMYLNIMDMLKKIKIQK